MENGYEFPVIVDKVVLLFTILVAKSIGVHLIMSSSPYMYLFRILRYVLCLVIVIELLLYFCCVLYNLNSQMLLSEIESLP